MPDRRVGVPSFASVDEAILAHQRKDSFQPSDLYPRDGTRELAQLEDCVAGLARVRGDRLLLYNSGMTAVVEAVELASPTAGTTILHSTQIYSQSGRYFEHLRLRGVRSIVFDPGDLEATDAAIRNRKPDVIFIETVANAPEMPVLDIDRFLDLPAVREQDPLVVIDNTMTTPSVLPLGETAIGEDRRVVIVESGTKSYALNGEMVGLVYTGKELFLHNLKVARRMKGLLPSASSVATIVGNLPNRVEFDDRNRKIVLNNKLFAEVLDHKIGNSGAVRVVHPNLPDHPNYAYTSSKYPDGASQVLFVVCDDKDIQEKLMREFWDRDPLIREACRLGQSFGFDKTTFWFDASFPSIRVSCGVEKPLFIKEYASRLGDVALLFS